MVVNKKPKSVAVDPKTGQASGSSTLRASGAAPAPPPTANPFGLERAKGTSSATYGQVSPTGRIEVAPYGGGVPVSDYGTPQQVQAQGQPQSVQQSTPPPPAGFGSSSQQSFGDSNQSPKPTFNGSAGTQSPNGQTRNVTVKDKKGNNVTYSVNSVDSFKSQTGQYEFDFFTLEGQLERRKEAADAILKALNPFDDNGLDANTGFQPLDSVLEVIGNNPHQAALTIASIYQVAAPVFKAIEKFNNVGSLALTTQGVKDLTSTIPAAQAVAPTAVNTGKAVLNTKTAEQAAKAFVKTAFKNKIGKMGIGSVLSIGGLVSIERTISYTNKGNTDIKANKEEYNAHYEASTKLAADLRKVGMFEEADEIQAYNNEVAEAIEAYRPILQIIDNPKISAILDKAKLHLSDARRSYEQLVYDQAQEEADRKTAADAKAKQDAELAAADAKVADKARQDAKDAQKREQDLQDAATKRQQELQDAETKRRQELADRADQRSFDVQREAERLQAEQKAQDTALTGSGGSTLGFGLLGTGDSPEFVDKDKAAKVYFGKVYEELTPEQRALLNLLKKGD